MDWIVKNAINRDVERQHLNKILKDIEQRVSAAGGGSSLTEADVNRIVQDAVRASGAGTLRSVNVTLQGDVTGSGSTNAVGRIVIDTEIDPDVLGVQEAPIDGRYYWRISGEWQQVPDMVTGLSNISDTGIIVYNGDVGSYASVEIEGTEDEIVVTDGDGVFGNPVVSLADLADTGVGTGPVKLYTRDSKGRIEGEEDADTDDLPEGATNLYFTDERAQDAAAVTFYDVLKEKLVAGANVILTPNDLDEELVISATGGGGGGGGSVDTVTSGTGITVNNTDPANPVVALSSGSQAAIALANTAVQPGANITTLTNNAGYTTNTGTVTSVAVTGTDGIEVDSGSPITTAGTVQLGLSSTVLGQLADAASAVQPGDLATVATTGDYNDLDNLPTIPDSLDDLTGDSDDVAEGTTNLYFTPAERTKLSGIAAGAQVNTVTSVNTQTGAVVLTAANVGAEVAFSKGDLIAGTNVTFSGSGTGRLVGSGNLTINATGGGGSGTVTSVGLSVPTGLQVSGSPVTTSGTLAVTYASGYVGYTTTEQTKLAGIATGATANTGTVTSVNLANSTGLTASGGPITSTGSLTYTLSANLQTWHTITPSAFGTLLVTSPSAAVTRGDLGLGALATANTINGAMWSGTPLSVGNITGLGTAAYQNIGTSGANVPLMSTANTWSTWQRMTSAADGTSSGASGLEVLQATNANDSFMTFHISGHYAAQFGLDHATNDLFYGGWSVGAVKHRVWHAGNFDPGTKANVSGQAFTGNISAPTISSSGTITSGTTFASSTTNVVLGPSSNGGVFLRPNGVGSTTGQTILTSNGILQVTGNSASTAGGRVELYSSHASGVPGITFFDNSSAFQGGVYWNSSTDAIDFFTGASDVSYRARLTTGGRIEALEGFKVPNTIASDPTSLTQHIDLYGGVYGFSITDGTLNHVVPASSKHSFVVDGVEQGKVDGQGMGAYSPVTGTVVNVRSVPVWHMSSDVSIVQAHRGSAFVKNNNTARTVTLEPNSTQAIEAGTMMTFVNRGGSTGNLVIARGSGVAIYRNGVNADITLTPGNSVTLLKVATDVWQA